MISTTGIVINSIKYSESSLIVKIYTLEHGMLSFIAKGIRRAKSKKSPAFFFPFSILEINYNHQSKRELQTLGDVRFEHPVMEILSDMNKTSIALFLCEILSICLYEQNHDPKLFSFIKNSIIKLNETPEKYANFHLAFLLKLSLFLGFYPNYNLSKNTPYFNIEEGCFQAQFEKSPIILNQEESQLLASLLHAMENKQHLPLVKSQRNQLLNIILDFYRQHIPNFKELKTLGVFKALQ
ncbi:MAG: DNA repair protein RecO [Bacteroidales bacterium]